MASSDDQRHRTAVLYSVAAIGLALTGPGPYSLDACSARRRVDDGDHVDRARSGRLGGFANLALRARAGSAVRA